MSVCPKCRSENASESERCSACGSPLRTEPDESCSDANRKGEDFAEKLGREVEKAAEEIGRKASKDFEGWFHRTFGLAAPLLSTVFGFLFTIIAIEIFGFIGGGSQFRNDLNELLADYWLLLLALVFLGSYGDYMNKRHKKDYRPVYPFVFAAGFVGSLLFFCRFVVIVGDHWGVSFFVNAAEFVLPLLPLLFVLVLILGYFFVVVFTVLRESIRCL